MTSKERAALRAQANTLEPVFQVGKGGLSDALINQVEDALRVRELIKLKVLLETSPETPKVLAGKIAEATHSDVVQVIGGSMVFYRYNAELHEEKKSKKSENPMKLKRARIKVAKMRREAENRSAYPRRSSSERSSVGRGRKK